uniref:Uncharacterized protein n=1 Tax=Kalanchoe fedtschenkoi TaxID=63787 RepID=A0A7N1A8R1_KALFE
MAASGEFFRCPMDGCLSGPDGLIDRRPYHRNCKCELHKSRKHNCPAGSTAAKKGGVVSYPIRRSWSEGCLALSALSSPGYVSPAAADALAGKSKNDFQPGSSSDDDDLFPRINLQN